MTVNLENPKEPIKNLLELKENLVKKMDLKICKKKSAAFLYSGNKNWDGRNPFKTVKKKPL